MTDTELLKAAIRRSGVKLNVLCTNAGMTYATLRSKIANHSDFTATEINAISDTLHLTQDEIFSIFFAH